MSDKESDTKKDADMAGKSRVIVEQSNVVEAGAELSVSSSGVETSGSSLSPQPGPSTPTITFSDLKKVQLISDEDIQVQKRLIDLQKIPWTSLIYIIFTFQFFLEDNAYAVVPVPDCPHMSVVQPVPIAGVNINAPCAKCSSTQENWICLTCYTVR